MLKIEKGVASNNFMLQNVRKQGSTFIAYPEIVK